MSLGRDCSDVGRKPRLPRGAVLATSVVLAVATGLAQQPTFRAKVQLVRVDASVVDADGNPVLGLTADDFELFDRGTPQPIATFTAVHHDPPAAVPRVPEHRDVASNAVDDTSQLLVLVLDDLHIRKEWTAHARDVIVEFVKNLGGDVMVALLSTSGKYRVELTTDHARILDAINSFVGAETKLAFNAPGSTTSPPGRAGAGFSAAELKMRHLNPEGPPLSPMSSTTGNCRGTLTGPPADSEELFSLFESAAHILASDDRRRKGLAWISTGESFAAEGAREAIDALQGSGVVLYAIDPIGTKPVIADGAYDMNVCPGSRTFELVKSPWQVVADNKIASLTNTSRATGGFAVVNDDDLAGGVRKIVQDFGEYYVLGFYPDDLTTAGARPLEVKMKRPGLTVHARLSYEMADATAPSPANALGALSGGLVPTGDLPLRLYAVALPSPTSSRADVVAVTVEVTAKTADLTDDRGVVRDRLQYEVNAVNLDSGALVRSAARDATLELGHRADPLPPSVAYAVDAALSLAPGRYQVRVSAISARTGTGGSVFLPIDVPDFRGRPLVMSDLILGESTVPVAAGADFNVLHTDRVLPFAPTLDRVFDRSRVLRTFATVAADGKPVTATVSIAGSQDAVVWSDRRVLPASGRLDLSVPLAFLPPAPYRLRVSATDGPHTVTREVGFVIR